LGGNAAITFGQEGWRGRLLLLGAEPGIPVGRPPLSKTYLRSEEDLILGLSRSSPFGDPTRPPVEEGSGADDIGTRLQSDAALCLDVFQVVDRGEVPIGQYGIGERPKMFGRLQLRRIGRKEQQVDVLRHAQARAIVPASAVQHEHDLLVWTCPNLPCEGGQLHLEERDTDR